MKEGKEIIGYISDDLRTWKSIAAENSKDIAALKANSEYMGKDIKSIIKSVEKLDQRIEEHIDKIDKRIVEHNNKIEGISDKVDAMIKPHDEAMKIIESIKDVKIVLMFLSKPRNLIFLTIFFLLIFGVGIPLLQSLMVWLGIADFDTLSFLSYRSIIPLKYL